MIFKGLRDNKQGITLLELVIAVGLFSFTILSATQVFKAVIEGQRDAIASQDMQESIRYTFERVAKEIRMANKDPLGNCTVVSDKVYATNISEDELYFLNYKDECITYYLNNDRLWMTWDPPGLPIEDMPVTPRKLKVKNLSFKVDDSLGSEQSKVTMLIDLEVDTAIKKHRQALRIQTTLSSRYYE